MKARMPKVPCRMTCAIIKCHCCVDEVKRNMRFRHYEQLPTPQQDRSEFVEMRIEELCRFDVPVWFDVREELRRKCQEKKTIELTYAP